MRALEETMTRHSRIQRKAAQSKKKEQSLTPQDTEAIVDGLFKRPKECGAIPVNRGSMADTSINADQCLFYQADNLYTSKD